MSVWFLPSEKFVLAEARGPWNAAQTLAAARAAGDWLAQCGMKPGEILACGFGNRREAVVLGLGAVLAGVNVLPLTPAELFNNPASLIERLGCSGVLLDEGSAKKPACGPRIES